MKPYIDFVNIHMPMVLSSVDRDEDSKTYGSCDRNYWHLKIRDFSSAILQQTCLTLALAYLIDFDGNICYQKEEVRKWSVAALSYMGKIQLKDGSFNEYYPNEHGFPPTAFNLYAGCMTYLLLGVDDKKILNSLIKAAQWLSCHDETKAFNQEVAALAGLALLKKITGVCDFDKNIEDKVNILLSVYCSEGWFPEQGGADIGYSSVALDMLIEYYEATGDERMVKPLLGMVDFLSAFVHPDGTIGGEYGSRNTIYFMPNGLEGYIRNGLDSGGVAAWMVRMLYEPSNSLDDFMLAVDERYLSHYVMHSYLRAIGKYIKRTVSKDAYKFESRCYPTAGLFTYAISDCYVICGASKGGLIKIYKNDKELFWDCGYRIHLGPGRTAATNWLDKYSITKNKNEISISGSFHLVKQKLQKPIYHLGLRILAKLIGGKLNKLIKRLTIFQKSEYPASFKRLIRFFDDKVIIEDWIDGIQGNLLKEANNVSLRLVASGKFFSRSDILRAGLCEYGRINSLHRIREVSLVDGDVKTEVL